MSFPPKLNKGVNLNLLSESEKYKEYEKLKQALRNLLLKKKNLDRRLANLEEEIYNRETNYLEDLPNGNIVKGFDNYIRGGLSTQGNYIKRKGVIQDEDRIFSLSSATYMKHMRKAKAKVEDIEDERSETPDLSTPRKSSPGPPYNSGNSTHNSSNVGADGTSSGLANGQGPRKWRKRRKADEEELVEDDDKPLKKTKNR